ncbi:MAG: adenylyltransferase/cytidyltransferase family protein, partial [Bacteroidales bacterium]|nr:adenylyltransferase/cytidyltransferase family protein [Bacteroidales bacterium]
MNHLDSIREKIVTDPQEMMSRIAAWRRQGLTVVFTNGCFDILHTGHVSCLAQAADLGDRLIVALNTDASVRRLKGPSRPVNPEDARACVIAALEATDMVVFFDTPTPLEILQQIRPDILAKGGDYRPEDIVGYDLLRSYGGRVVTLP